MVEPAVVAAGAAAGTGATQPFFNKLLKQATDAEDDEIEAQIKAKCQASTNLAEKLMKVAGAGTGDAAAQAVYVKALEAGSTKDDYEKQLLLLEDERDTLGNKLKLATLNEEKSRDQASRAKTRAEEADKRASASQADLVQANAAIATASKSANSGAAGAGGAAAAGAGASGAEVKKLKSDLKNAVEKAAGRLKEMEKMEGDIDRLTQAELKARLGAGRSSSSGAGATPEELQQQLKHAADVLANEQRRFDVDREKMRGENSRKHRELEASKVELGKFTGLATERKAAMQKTVDVFKADFARLKSERDKAKLQLKSAGAAGSPAQRKAAKEAADAIDALREESKRHQGEVARLQAQLRGRTDPAPELAGEQGIKTLRSKLLNGELSSAEIEKNLRKLVDEVFELRAAAEDYKGIEEVLSEEIEATGKSLEDERKTNTSLRKQLNDKEEALYEMMSAKSRSEQALNAVQAKTKINSDLIKALKEEVAKKTGLINTQRENDRVLRDAKTAAEKRARDAEMAAQAEHKQHETRTRTFNEVVQERDRANKNAEKCVAEAAAKAKAARKAERELNRLKEDHRIAKRELADYQNTSGGSASTEGFKELIEDLRKKVRCPACNVNERSVALNACGHTFCLSCVETRYKNRDRKCPSCSKPIAHKAWTKIFFA